MVRNIFNTVKNVTGNSVFQYKRKTQVVQKAITQVDAGVRLFDPEQSLLTFALRH